jgi:hypothetical protein
MSKRYNNGSHYEKHPRADELHDGATHAHDVAELSNGKQDHPTAHEHSRRELEHSPALHQSQSAATTGHGVASFGHNDIAILAHKLWQDRGCPEGTPDEDWFRAAEELRSHARGH